MQVRILLNGQLELQDENGAISRIGPEHPDYRLHLRSIRIDPKKARIAGIVCVLAGVGGMWLNWHDLATSGYYDLRLVFWAPPTLVTGLTVLLPPKNARPAPGEPNVRSRKVMAIAVVVLMLVATGLNWYLLANYRP